MKKSRIWRSVLLGINTLMLHKLRSMLTMLGVVFGVASVIAMLAVGEGASKDALEQIRKLGSNNIILSSQKPVEEESGGSMRSPFSVSMYGLTYDDETRAMETFSRIRTTAPAKIVRKEGRLGTRTLDLRLVGTTADWFRLVKREMIAGRTLLPSDVDQKAAVVVLTEYGARRLLATRQAVGQSLRLGGEYFQVIGIVRSEGGEGSSVQTPDQQVDAYLPITVARERYGDVVSIRTSGSFIRERVELHQLIVEVENTDHVETVAAGLEQMLKTFHPKGDYRISVPLALLKQAEATKRTFNIVLGSIAGISLLVGGIGIMNIMLASVTERTREIGVRRAIGAKKRQIITQFLIETMVLSTLGGMIGIAIGVAIPALITYFADMATVVTSYSLLLSVGISMSVGLIFGLYPAKRAADLDPIIALRHE
ncbi:MAG: ABC transporter permease [Verrucomicrobiota bacterium]|jgi:putative ABC transport system permease protein|nr:ABC transporter permease [Verrucomicrobiota bacterium]MDD8051282.1 ABC transporter permease [Verrucomicrobiota bacterium]MDI9382966.1 ABC transporter permease [Verrucomicrobiota bacterium]HCF96419.1 macrolide export ATP-binding/permease MacB [Verrucomicrobiota bacterium]